MTVSDPFSANGIAAGGKPLKIAILGCGYLGGRFAREATEQGHEVSALTRNPQRVAELWAMGLRKVAQGLLHEDEWHSQLDEPEYDLVVNCVSSAGGGLEGYKLSYLDGMESLRRWSANGHKIKHFLYTGSTGVYPQIHGEVVAEGDIPAERTSSGELLVQAEELVRQMQGQGSGQFGRATVLRLGGIYGPGRTHLLSQLRKGNTAFPGAGDFIINHIHVDDAARAIWAAQLRPQADAAPAFSIYNTVDGAYPTKEEVILWLAEQVGVAPEKVTFNNDEVTARAIRRQVAGLDGNVMPNRRVSNAAIRHDLGWSPKYPSFREGYQALLQA